MPRLVPAAALALVTTLAAPAQAFWCDGELVLEGDSLLHVRDICGDPASSITTTESITRFVAGASRLGYVAGTSVTQTIQVDTLVYDFGPTRFMEELRFENGVLVSSRSLGRGSRRRRDRD